MKSIIAGLLTFFSCNSLQKTVKPQPPHQSLEEMILNTKPPFEIPTIVRAIEPRGIKKLQRLLMANLDPNTTNPGIFNETALHRVCGPICGPNSSAARLLLEHGAQPNLYTSGLKRTPLMEAAQNGFSRIVTLLLEHGAHKDLVDAQGNSALMLAEQRLTKVRSDKKRKNLLDTIALLKKDN